MLVVNGNAHLWITNKLSNSTKLYYYALNQSYMAYRRSFRGRSRRARGRRGRGRTRRLRTYYVSRGGTRM